MSTAIVRQQDAAVNSFGDVQRIAEMFALSNYFDAKGTTPVAVAQIVTKIMAGRELGYGPFASVNGIHVIQGRTALGANLMAAAVKASGRYDYRVRRMDGEACEIEFFERVDGKRESLGVSSFTAADAKAAGTKNMQQFARNMLFARAMSNGVTRTLLGLERLLDRSSPSPLSDRKNDRSRRTRRRLSRLARLGSS